MVRAKGHFDNRPMNLTIAGTRVLLVPLDPAFLGVSARGAEVDLPAA